MASPIMFKMLNKDLAKQFLIDNEVEVPKDATKNVLMEFIERHFQQLGLNVDYFDFQNRYMFNPPSHRKLTGSTPVMNQSEDVPTESEKKQSVNLPPPQSFSLSPQNTQASRWNEWLDEFDIYLKAMKFDVQSKDCQRNIFLHVAGAKIQKLLKNLPEDDTIEDSFQRAKNALSRYFEPKKNKYYEISVFKSLKQTEDEPIDTFVTRLRDQATHCEFPDVDARILEQLIDRSYSKDYRRKLMVKGNDLTFHQAMEIGRSFESVSEKMDKLEASSENVSRVVGKSSGESNSIDCFFCGSKHVKDRRRCPAFHKKCGKCGGMNHFAKCCKSKFKKKNKKQSITKKKINVVDHGSSDEDELFVSQIHENLNKNSLYTKLNLNGGGRVKFLVDTGAMSCILPLDKVPKSAKIMEVPNLKLKSYSNNNIEVVGKVTCVVSNPKNDECYQLDFVVVPEGEPILGLKAILAMNLIKIQRSNIFRVSSCKYGWNELKKNFFDVFDTSKVGEIKGHSVKIHLKDDALPVFRRSRPVPFALEKKVEKAINESVLLGILEPVSFSEWASPVVSVVKPSGEIRLCADFKATLNPQLKVEHHPLPSIEHLFAKIKSAKYMTKLDFSRAFEQLVVDEKCREPLTINTCLGLFRYRRLPFGCSSSPALCQKVFEQLLHDIPLSDLDTLLLFIDTLICLLCSNSEEELFQLTNRVLSRLKDVGAKLNWEKCMF